MERHTQTHTHTHKHIHTHRDSHNYSMFVFEELNFNPSSVLKCPVQTVIAISTFFGKRYYRVLVRVCVVCVCFHVCVCFCTITKKEIDLRTQYWNTL